MGCVASRLEEEEEVVSICRERKQQLKLAVERRYALADAHYRYCQALYGVSAALKLFVARHSQPSSPFLITFPPPSPPRKENVVVSNPLFLQQTPSEPRKEAIGGPCEPPLCDAASTTTSSDSSEQENDERNEQKGEQVCGHFYMEMPPPPSIPSPQRDFGWDFFNPFMNVRTEVLTGYHRISEDDLRLVREQEGIPELEEEDEEEDDEEGGKAEAETSKVVLKTEEKGMNVMKHEDNGVEAVNAMDNNTAYHGDEQTGFNVIDTPEEGRELLEALGDIEDYFRRAYDAGKDVTRMLEANRVHLQTNLEEIKENSTKIIQSITWKAAATRSPSCKSLVASSSKSSSTWTEFRNDLFDDYGGMASGSHSLTLGRLYAWEKKLYEEVKAGDSTRKLYDKKCKHLQNLDVRGDEGPSLDKTRALVKDLYSRILVAIRSAETISNRIDKLRDEELQPQIIELLQGMLQSWKIMSESHEIQNKIMFEVKTYNCPTYGKFCNNSHRLATLQLEAELHNWRTCFTEYITTQKSYVAALHGWLSKFVVPEVEYYSRGRNSAPLCRANGPLLLTICHDWLSSMEKLPDKTVAFSIKSCGKDVRALWNQQGEEQQQKRKVDILSKDLDRKILTFQKAENRIFEFKLTDHQHFEPETDQKTDYLNERKDLLDNFKKKVDLEKERHQSCMQETQRITLNGFRTGLGRVFESMLEFSKAALQMYSDLLSNSSNVSKHGNQSYIEGSQVEEDGKS